MTELAIRVAAAATLIWLGMVLAPCVTSVGASLYAALLWRAWKKLIWQK